MTRPSEDDPLACHVNTLAAFMRELGVAMSSFEVSAEGGCVVDEDDTVHSAGRLWSPFDADGSLDSDGFEQIGRMSENGIEQSRLESDEQLIVWPQTRAVTAVRSYDLYVEFPSTCAVGDEYIGPWVTPEWLRRVSQPTEKRDIPTEKRDIVDEIDALVDEQMAGGEPEVGFDFGNPTFPDCPRCDRHWHGLPITERVAEMYAAGEFDSEYLVAKDDSPVICYGSEFIGPMPAEGPHWSRLRAMAGYGMSMGPGWRLTGANNA